MCKQINQSMAHIESCEKDDCEVCRHLVEFYMTCDGCLTVGHMDSMGWIMDPITQLVYCLACGDERGLE